MLSKLLVVSVCLLASASAANILVSLIGISGSQNLIMIRFAEHLADRGHNVVVLKATYFPEAKMPKMNKVKLLEYTAVPKSVVDEMAKEIWAMPWLNTPTGMPPFGLLKGIFDHLLLSCGTAAEPKSPIMTELQKTKWDVAVIHMVDFCAFGIAEVLKIKATIWMSTAMMFEPMAWASGVPMPVSYVPASSHVTGPEMDIFARGKNALITGMTYGLCAALLYPGFDNVFREKYGIDFPSMDTLTKRTQLYYINSDPFFEWPRPIQHNIIYVGGLTMQKPQPLDENWQKFVDNAGTGGIVVFSLGTVANTSAMPHHKKMALLNAFKKFPDVSFVYRLEGEFNDAKNVKNVLLTKWLPQKDLLANPKVRAFITHGGYNSLTEATYHGVPLIMMPLFGDQYANMKRVENAGVGVMLDKNTLSPETVTEALKKVLYDKEMQARSDRLAEMIHNRPTHPLDEALNWVEFLAKFKTLHMMQPRSRHMPLYQYWLLDILTIVAVAFAVFLWLSLFLCRRCYKFCCGTSASSRSSASKSVAEKKKRQ